MFYLPIYFHSIHGQSAVTSGVNTLPFLAFVALGAMVSGAAIGKTRYTQPYVLMTAGMALIYILDIDSSKAMYTGAEVLFGFGIGICNQIPMTAVQGFSNPEDVASATGIMVSKYYPKKIRILLCMCTHTPPVCQTLSGAYFVVVAQSLFANRMLQTLLASASNHDPALVLGTGASELQHVFSGDDLTIVIAAYMVGVKDVFAFSLACAALSVLLALVIPFKKLPDHGKKPATETKKREVVDEKKEVGV